MVGEETEHENYVEEHEDCEYGEYAELLTEVLLKHVL